MPMKAPKICVLAKLAQTAAIFVITSVISLLILSRASPVVWEDHFQIGQNLRSTGSLTIDDVPSIFRPPGYPGFVAFSLWVGDLVSIPKGVPEKRASDRDQRIVVFAQGFLLGAMAAALFFWTSLWSERVAAVGIALAAVLNPYSLALANLVSYHLLFVVLTIFSTLGLLLLRRFSSSGPTAVGVGIFWGLTSLVKPVTLVIPLFVAPLMLLRLPSRPAIKSNVLVLIGMICIVGPYVGRNYMITGQPIITAQSGFAFWGSSVEKVASDKPFLVWQPIWWKYGMPIFTKITGSTEYSGPLLNAYAVQLNAEFSKEARHNIIAAPEIYLYNILRNFISFNLDTMGFWNRIFIADNKRFAVTLSDFWSISLMTLAAAGLIWGCIKKDDDAMIVTTIYMGIVVAHSISFATEVYTIAKLPLILLGFALMVRRLESMPRYGLVLAWSTACGMAALGLVASGLATP
jgi:hypothetical protein